MNENFKKIIALLLIQSYVLVLVPARELRQEFFQSHNSTDYAKIIYNNNNELSEVEFEKIESIKNNDLICDDVFRSDEIFFQEDFQNENNLTKNLIEEKSFQINSKNENKISSLFLIHKSELYRQLIEAKNNFEFFNGENFTKKIHLEETEKVKSEWEKIANTIIENFLQNYLESEKYFSEENFQDDNENAEIEISKIKKDFYRMENEVYNSLLNEFLYDQKSLRRESDKESAQIIADELAREIENSTNEDLNKLFNSINPTFSKDARLDDIANNVVPEDISVTKENWLLEFSSQIEKGISKWDEAEKTLLSFRADFEENVETTYQKDLEIWASAYDELLLRRENWNKEINNRIEEGIALWNQQGKKLSEQIFELEEETKNELYEQYEQKKQYFVAAQQMYSKTRVLLATAQKGILSCATKWTEKYDGIYSYWKTEYNNRKNELENLEKELEEKLNAGKNVDAEYEKFLAEKNNLAQPEENPLLNFQFIKNENQNINQICNENFLLVENVQKKFLQTLISVVSKNDLSNKKNIELIQEIKNCNTNSSSEEIKNILEKINQRKNEFNLDKNLIEIINVNNLLWSNLENLKNWILILQENSENLKNYKNSIVQILNDENDFYSSEIQTEIFQYEEIKNYWENQVEIAKYVYDYTVDKTSFVDTLEDTKLNLENATIDFENVQNDYKNAVENLQIAEKKYFDKKNNYEIQQEKVKTLFDDFEKVQNEYSAIQNNVALIELQNLKEKLIENINSINSVEFNSFSQKENLSKYLKTLRDSEYKNIYLNGLNFIEQIKSAQTIVVPDEKSLLENFDINDVVINSFNNEYANEGNSSDENLNVQIENTENENKITYEILSLEELKKIIDENPDDAFDKLEIYNKKIAQIEFIKNGTFLDFIKTDEEKNDFIKTLRTSSVLFQKKIDDDTILEIGKILEENIFSKKSENILLTDSELQNVFDDIQILMDENKVSEFVRTGFNLLKSQIIKEQNKNENLFLKENMLEKLSKINFTQDNSSPLKITINENNFFIENYLLFFTTQNFLQDDFNFNLDFEKDAEFVKKEKLKIEENFEKENNKLYELYSLLFLDEENYKKLFLDLQTNITTVFEKETYYKKSLEDDLLLKSKVESFEKEYNDQLKFLDNDLFSAMKKSFLEYENELKIVEEKNEMLKNKKTNLQAAKELYTWAENQYLHLDYSSSEIFSPLEKYNVAKLKFKEAKNNLENFLSVLENTNQQKNILMEGFEQNSKMLQISKVLKTESSDLIQKSKDDLYKAQIEEYNSIFDVVKIQNEFEKENFKENQLPLSIIDFVILEKNIDENNSTSYKISLRNFEDKIEKLKVGNYERQNISESEYAKLISNIKDYLFDKEIVQYDIYGNEHKLSKSEKDCFEFLASFNSLNIFSASKNYSFDDVVLASCYLKMMLNDKSIFKNNFLVDENILSPYEDLFFEKENPYVNENYPFKLSNGKIFNTDCAAEYRSGRIEELTKAYNKVVQNNGKDDIAKFLFFSNLSTNENFDFKKYEIDLIASSGFNKIKNEFYSQYDLYNGLGIGSTAVAVATLPLCFWNPGLIAVVAAATVAAVTFFSTSDTYHQAYSDTNNIQKGYLESKNYVNEKQNSFIKKYFSNLQNREFLEKEYNLKLYGSENFSDEILTFEKFDVSLKKMFLKKNDSSITYDFFKTLKIPSKENSTFKDLFEIATKGKNCTDVLSALDFICEYLENEKIKSYSILEEDANEKFLLHQKEKEKIEFYKELNLQFDKKLLVENFQLNNFENINALTENDYYKINDDSIKIQLYKNAFGKDSWSEENYKKNLLNINLKLFLDYSPILFSREEENYISENFSFMNSIYNDLILEKLDNQFVARHNSNEIILNDFSRQFDDWKNQMNFILSVSDSEWEKAQEKLNYDFNNWQKNFSNQYSQNSNLLDLEYENFLIEKNDWINTQYVIASLSGTLENNQNIESQNELDLKIQNIKSSAKNLVSKMNNSFDNPLTETFTGENSLSEYISTLFDSSIFNSINNFGLTLNQLTKVKDEIFYSNSKINFNEFEKQNKINSFIKSVDEKMKKAASLYSSQIAQEKIYEQVQQVYDNIDRQNLSMEEWENDLVRKDGYTVGEEISRNAVVDSTLTQNSIREKQTVHKYEWFKCIYPKLSFNFNNLSHLDSDSINILMNESFSEVNNWQNEIFGNENQKGALTLHIGEAPVLVSNVDTNKSREENIKKSGSGQIGIIMLDYLWNSIVNSQGYAALGTPLYDKKLTRDNVIFGVQLPTLREITDVVCEIVGNATGQKWISYFDDIVFGALDLQLGAKTFSELMEVAAKKGLQQLVSFGASSLASAASKGFEMALEKVGGSVFDKIVGEGVIKMSTSYLSSVASSQVNSINISDGFKIDFNQFNQSWTNSNFVLGALGDAANHYVSTAANYGFDNLFMTDGIGKNLSSNVFNTAGISNITNSLSTVAGGFAQFGITGNVSFNLLNSSNFGIPSQTGNGVGLLCVDFNRDTGVSSKFSSSGIDFDALSFTKNIFDGSLSQMTKVASAKFQNSFGQNESLSVINAINALGFSGSERNYIFAKDVLADNAKIIFDDNLNDNKMGLFNSDNPNEVRINSKLKGTSAEAAVDLATVFAHEGTHFYGNRQESLAHIAGSLTYETLSDIYQTEKNANLIKSMQDEIENLESWKENDGNIDYWKFYADGTIEDDGKNYFSIERAKKDENGNSVFEEVANSAFVGDSAAALVKAVSAKVIQQYFGKSFESINDFSDEAIMNALGVSKHAVANLRSSNSIDLKGEKQLFNKLLGNEFLLSAGNKKIDGVWKIDESVKKSATVELKVQGLKSGESLNVRCSPDGKFDFYTVNAYLYRNANSFNAYAMENGKINKINSKNAANSHILFEKRDLMTNEEDYLVVSGNLSTIDKLSQDSDETYIAENGMEVPGNTISSERFKLRFDDAFEWNKNDYNSFVIGIISDADTLNGQHIGEDGRASPDGERWLFHPTDAQGYVKGCFGSLKDANTNGSWNDLKVKGSGVYNYEKMLYDLNYFGVDKGYQINGNMYGQLTPDYYRESVTEKEKALEQLARTSQSDSLNIFTPEVSFDSVYQYKATPQEVKEVIKNNPVTYKVPAMKNGVSQNQYSEYITNQINSAKKAEFKKTDSKKYLTFTRIQEIEKKYKRNF